jgi:predicted metal-dependent hydrolase
MLKPEEIQQIKNFYQTAFENLNGKSRYSEIEVSFYPYIGINHTIRVRGGRVFVRIAELFRNAPPEVQNALAWILVAKLLRKKVSPAALETYNEYLRRDEIQQKSHESRKARGRKIVTTAKGEVYDLEEIFARLNRIYFQNRLPKPVLTWSAQKTFQRLGHHDATHDTIVISKSLDDRNVPEFVVDYVVYHEMLHVKHPTVHRNGRRYNHTPAFRRDEEKFAFYDEAEDWIERNSYALKRKVKRQKRAATRNRLR